MKTALAVAGLIFLLPELRGQPELVVFQDSGRDWAEVYVRMPPAEFSLDRARRIVLGELQSFETKRVVKIVVGTAGDDILHLRRGKAMTRYPYELWAALASESLRRRRPLAMAIAVGGDAVLKIRGTGGRPQQIILRGGDPLAVSTPAGNVQIRHIAFSKIPVGGQAKVFVNLYVDTGRRLSVDEVQEAALAVGQAIALEESTLAVFREDPWFLENQGFPPVDPFFEVLKFPTLEQYVCSATFVCGLEGRNAACLEQDYLWGRCGKPAVGGPRP